MRMYPQPEETLNQVHLIRYYKDSKAQKRNEVKEIGFAKQIRIVVPYKRYDEKFIIPETEGTVNFHDSDSYVHTRLENGKVVKYDAVDKYIWEITDLEGVPKGMINEFGSPIVTRCKFYHNRVRAYGGGMWNYESKPTLTNCIFYANDAEGGGGGIYNREYSSPSMTNCLLWGNITGGWGGGSCSAVGCARTSRRR